MNFDLKIGAVFSLADDRKETQTGSDRTDLYDESSHLLPDHDKVTMYGSDKHSENTDLPNIDVVLADNVDDNSDKSSTELAMSYTEDPDAPPSLLLEDNDSSPLSQSLVPGLGSLSPPVLLREEPLKRAVPVVKKKCTKIDPCYIVLTNIEPTMNSKMSISSRAFKRSFVECSNMCKKVMFRRRLKAGKDVFNVKTPSKQKDYLLYLMKVEEERFKKHKKNSVQCTKIQDIIDKHDLKIAARKKASGKTVHPRVRRTITKLPKDFVDRPASPLQDEIDENKKDFSAEEVRKLQDEFVKKKHKVELNSLKRLIGIKRSLNQNLKKSKRLRPEAFESFLKSDVTSNVSGRVRKVNPKYGDDFAMSRKDFEEQRLFEVAQSQLKRAESESKRKQEEISNDFILQKRKKVSMLSNKKPKPPVILIENADNDDVLENPVKAKKSKLTSKKVNMKTNALKNLLESPLCGLHNDNQMLKRNKDKDAVLIQDLPKADSLITGFLKEAVNPLPQKESVTEDRMTSRIEVGDQYGRAKQLLKDSLDKSRGKLRFQLTQVSPKQEPLCSSAETSQEAIVQEKYKVLKIPETVQKLFKPTEIKQEPPDDGYESTITTSTTCNTTKVVTVAYSNGIYKKVLMSVPRTTAETSIQHDITTAKSPYVASSPILVNTNQGLRYLVPSQMFSKLPSYSDAMKAKVFPLNSPASTVTTIASSSSMNNYITSSNNNILKTFNSLTGLQSNPQARVNSGVPTILQIPINNALNNPTSNASLKPTVTVNQLNVNQSNQESLINSKPLTTQTVVHKVSPVAKNNSVQNMSTTIHQQSAPLKNTSDFLSSQKSEKCKFYLLKIDGKNVLIPIEGNQAQPKAFVVNSDVICSSVQSNTVDSFANVAKVRPTEGIRPTLLGGTDSSVNSQQKPTLAVVPSMKPGNTVVRTPVALVPTTSNFSEKKSRLQTVTLTNVGTVSKAGVVSSKDLCVANNVNTNITTCAKSLKAITINLSKSGADITKLSSENASIMRTTQAFTNVDSSASDKLAPKPMISPPDISLSNVNSTTPSSMTLMPVYLKPSDSTTPGILQLRAVAVGKNSLLSAKGNQPAPQSDPKPAQYVTNMQSKQPNGNFLQTQVSPFKNPSLIKHGQSLNIAVKDSVRSHLKAKRESQTKTLQGLTTKISYSGSVQKDRSACPPVVKQGQTINDKYIHEENRNNTDDSNTLCDKSGVFVTEACDSVSGKAAGDKPEPMPFKEAVTAREERLRRLKELLREKQKAVEEIRSNIPK